MTPEVIAQKAAAIIQSSPAPPWYETPALLAASIAAAVALVSLLINVLVQRATNKANRVSQEEIARANREAQEALAAEQQRLTRRQIKLTKNDVLLKLLPTRMEAQTELIEAITAFAQALVNQPGGASLRDPRRSYWKSKSKVRQLFGADVVSIVQDIEGKLIELEAMAGAMMERKAAGAGYNRKDSFMLTDLIGEISRMKLELRRLMDGYSGIGLIRRGDAGWDEEE